MGEHTRIFKTYVLLGTGGLQDMTHNLPFAFAWQVLSLPGSPFVLVQAAVPTELDLPFPFVFASSHSFTGQI